MKIGQQRVYDLKFERRVDEEVRSALLRADSRRVPFQPECILHSSYRLIPMQS